MRGHMTALGPLRDMDKTAYRSVFISDTHLGTRGCRAEFLAEKQYQADLRRIERANRQRRQEAPRVTRIERQAESDDEVRVNIPPDLVPLFERVKRSIKASPRMSRTEAFLKYAEEHPEEVLEVIEDKTEAMIRELEAQHRDARRAARRPGRRADLAPRGADVPF